MKHSIQILFILLLSSFNLKKCDCELQTSTNSNKRNPNPNTRTKSEKVSALIIVDVQNDFVSGSLAVKDAAEIFRPINRLLHSVDFDYIYYSQDWHPENHISFVENVRLRPLAKNSPIQNPDEAKAFDTVIFNINGTETEQTLYPAHCVQNSSGAKLDHRLKFKRGSRTTVIKKGTNPDVDSYSVFFDNMRKDQTPLVGDARAKGVTDFYVCGLAYDICVGYTALDALRLGYSTFVIDDAARGIDEQETRRMKHKIVEMGGKIVNSRAVKVMVEGHRNF